MVRRLQSIGAVLLAFSFLVPTALASSHTGEPSNVTQAGFASRCANVDTDQYPECADAPSECGSKPFTVGDKTVHRVPFNCLFIEEPIGGRPGYDMYVREPSPEGAMMTTLYYGEAITGLKSGPFQAILVFEEGKDSQGPFGLLYNYLGLVYNYMSGIIIAFVILVVIISGVRIITARGDTTKYEEGKKWIIKALFGMVLWFTASVILYTINPTFFAF